MKHINLKITGEVQGVFFRMEAKKKAEQLGLSGFAENHEDGTVYIELEGEESLLEEFVNWAKNGPSLANVEDVEIMEEEGLKGFEDFTVRARSGKEF